MTEAILGLSAYFHDSAAAVLVDGDLVAAAQEERFTRKKHDPSFPAHATRYVLEEAHLDLDEIDAVVFYDKPLLKFERLLETYHRFAPVGFGSFRAAAMKWMTEKLFMRRILRRELAQIGGGHPPIRFTEHHLSHAASAFYPSPFETAAIVTIDSVGEWATTTIGYGDKNQITLLRQLDFPHSVGLLYSTFTYFCGFRVNSGEYKLMGLSAYGDAKSSQTIRFKQIILDHLIDLRADGSLLLNMKHFTFATSSTMCHRKKWERLLGIPYREPESEIRQEHANLALAIQQVTETIVLRICATAQKLTSCSHLCMAGGVALNCVANSKVLKEGIFQDIWVQPAAGDAGGAVGAVYADWHIQRQKPRQVNPRKDKMKGAFLGPQYSDAQTKLRLRRSNAVYQEFSDEDQLCKEVAVYLAQKKVVGWFQDRMEFGPRALGHRSILADPTQTDMHRRINQEVKQRESFRPFAPAVLSEACAKYFDLTIPSQYMLLVAPVSQNQRISSPNNPEVASLSDLLYLQRSMIPAVTHVDFSARIQTVHRDIHNRFWRLISAFEKETGCGLLINTSFNVRGEPIVCTPEDAYRCFMRTGMDILVIGNLLFHKSRQPDFEKRK